MRVSYAAWWTASVCGTKGLSTAIVQILNDASYAKALGKKGRQLVESTFRWEKIADGIIQAYERILAKAQHKEE